MIGHTPGPWAARYCDRVTRADDVDGTKSVAHVYDCPEQEANQHLIAAAPDMLDALKCIQAYLERWADEPECGHFYEVAATAIAKATGKPAFHRNGDKP